MSLIVYPDDGYDSLISLADCDAYQAAMGNAWSGTPERREVSLRRATRYLLAHYALLETALEPVHANVKAATCELAWRDLSGTALYDDVQAQAVVEETLGPMTTKYAAPANGGQRRFVVVDDLLSGLTRGGGQIRITRA